MRVGITIDGRVVPPQAAAVSVLDRGFFFGDGVAETWLARGDRAVALDLHLARLARSCEVARIVPPARGDVQAFAVAAVHAMGEGYAAVRVIVTRGASGLLQDDVDPRTPPTCVVIARAVAEPASSPEPIAVARAEAHFSGVRGIKTISTLPAFVERADARERGFDDVIGVDASGHVIEGATSNVIAVVRGSLVAPSEHALGGITRSIVLDLARAAGVPVEERALTWDELLRAHEIMLTSSLRGIAPVVRVEDRLFEVGRFTKTLQSRYYDRLLRDLSV